MGNVYKLEMIFKAPSNEEEKKVLDEFVLEMLEKAEALGYNPTCAYFKLEKESKDEQK